MSALAIHPHYNRAEEALRLIDSSTKKLGIKVVRFGEGWGFSGRDSVPGGGVGGRRRHAAFRRA